ncbi:MAG TPA: type II toxin-antitoxin system VapC family toxin [Pseudolabrys sp.]|nr:type II toxin-antitoxin system VapC family toxin [Pseudolabrys sp.]
MQPLLLDTCAVIWINEDEPIKPEAVALMNTAYAQGVTTFVSAITAWEVGLLTSRERLRLLVTPEKWFSKILDLPGAALAPLSPEILIASSYLPGKPPRDPADRIVAATARDLGATLITRDSALLTYGKQGHVNVIAC